MDASEMTVFEIVARCGMIVFADEDIGVLYTWNGSLTFQALREIKMYDVAECSVSTPPTYVLALHLSLLTVRWACRYPCRMLSSHKPGRTFRRERRCGNLCKTNHIYASWNPVPAFSPLFKCPVQGWIAGRKFGISVVEMLWETHSSPR